MLSCGEILLTIRRAIIDGRGPPSITPSPLPRSADLVPPPLRTMRTGSSSSIVSGGSFYQTPSEAGQSRTRPPLEGSHTPRAGSYNRSPFGESSPVKARRPSASDISLGATTFRDQQSNGRDGIGKGPPPIRHRSSSGEHVATVDPRKGSVASIYEDQPLPRMSGRKYSSEAMRPIPETDSGRLSIDEGRQPPNGGTKPGGVPLENANGPTNGEPKPKPKASPAVQTKRLAPTITTTLPSPVPQLPTLPSPASARPQRRASFHPPPMNTAFSREVLLTSRTGLLPGAAGLTVNEGKGADDAVLDNLEELLEGFDWTASTGYGGTGGKKGSADAIEGRLLDELTALDSVSIQLLDPRPYVGPWLEE